MADQVTGNVIVGNDKNSISFSCNAHAQSCRGLPNDLCEVTSIGESTSRRLSIVPTAIKVLYLIVPTGDGDITGYVDIGAAHVKDVLAILVVGTMGQLTFACNVGCPFLGVGTKLLLRRKSINGEEFK